MKIETPDNELIKAYIDGNDFAFNILMKKHQSSIFNFINSKIKDDDVSKDILQESLIKIILAIKSQKYKEDYKFKNYALRVTTNLIMDYFRTKTRNYKVSSIQNDNILNNIPDSNYLLECQQNVEENYSKIEKILPTLPYEQHQILLYRFQNDKSFKEIAIITNVSINTSLGRFRYAIDNIRKEILNKGIILDLSI